MLLTVASRGLNFPRLAADLDQGMPTHRDMPPGWDRAAAQRRALVDEAEARARTTRASLHSLRRPTAAELQATDRARAASSVPPPAAA